MNKQINVAFITPKLKQEWEALKEGNLQNQQLILHIFIIQVLKTLFKPLKLPGVFIES